MDKSKKETDAYYTVQDYNDTLQKLPVIVKIAEKKSLELMEPTIYEQREIINIIFDFVREKNRKIYGGTAVNALIKLKNASDAIYDDYHIGDIDFYSPSPIVDLVELCNILYDKKKYKNVNGKEAFHEESYRINVNMQMYCNITYVPKRIYHGIKTMIIDDISYVDPHFIWIDQLRISTSPLIDSRLWEQTFKRSYLLLKYYPVEIFNSECLIHNANIEMNGYIIRIKQNFVTLPDIQESVLINGFDAYNFFIRYAATNLNENMKGGNVKNSECGVPYLELTSVKYVDTVTKLYSFLKSIVKEPDLLSYTEYFPLFQFIGYSIIFTYSGKTLIIVTEASSVCIPIIRATSGVRYASYQYLLMSLLMNKFRAHLDKDKEMYFNYGSVISNLIRTRNNYLNINKLHNINDTAFSEYRIPCIGTPINPARLYVSRKNEKKENGKRQEFSYFPEYFFKTTEESQNKFDPEKACFKNTSGNVIANLKYAIFKVSGDQLIKNEIIESTPENCVELFIE